jgi:hypothetical protein
MSLESKAMKIHYDPQVDALYLRLSEGTIKDAEEVSPGIVLDYDNDNRREHLRDVFSATAGTSKRDDSESRARFSFNSELSRLECPRSRRRLCASGLPHSVPILSRAVPFSLPMG